MSVSLPQGLSSFMQGFVKGGTGVTGRCNMIRIASNVGVIAPRVSLIQGLVNVGVSVPRFGLIDTRLGQGCGRT